MDVDDADDEDEDDDEDDEDELSMVKQKIGRFAAEGRGDDA